ncbi:hypothetical protein [Burkholderia anthina]|uniref:hypothetical protein n=1 Tax=Burkholderia anthina TaxID=179879 RepID=UPI001AA03BF2|nr:hypothetical protein [Burkholderia anthina]QTD91286.1 hypothetical protein J4G50_07910 [Burkholderia anthina]
MARKSKADRVNEVLRLNPALSRNDPRISELIDAEALLRRVQRAAMKAPITVETRNGGTKRSPELIAVENANSAVRRLRNDLGIDRLNVKRSEAAGVKIKRSQKAQTIIDQQGDRYSELADLIPGVAAAWAAYGIVAEDLPENQRERFRSDLAEQADHIRPLRERLQQYAML